MIAVTPNAPTGTHVQNMGSSMLCCVRLIDHRTGLRHRVNGAPMQIFTRNPADAIEDLLRNRDPLNWDACVEPIAPAARSTGNGQ